jgi:hypothetical protein
MSNIFQDDDALRPQETAADRLVWAYGIEPNDLAKATVMDAADYRGQTRGVVVEDAMEQMGCESTRDWYVIYPEEPFDPRHP